MAVDIETIVRRVEKLLALGTSSNEHEAAAAVAKAQQIMLEHGLAMEQVTGKRPSTSNVKEGEKLDIFEYGKTTLWRQEVLEAVASTSGVHIAWGTRFEDVASKHAKYGTRYARIRTAYLIGFPGDVELAGYAFSFLAGEIDRLAQEHANEHWAAIRAEAQRLEISVHAAEARYTRWNGTHPLKAKASFTKGAALGVSNMLHEQHRQRREQTAGANALIVNRDAAIRDYLFIKRYGKTYAEWQADLKAATAGMVVVAKPAKPLTPAQLRKAQERAERQYQKDRERAERAEARKWANLDTTAYSRGYESGRNMAVRPGVKPGPAEERKQIG